MRVTQNLANIGLCYVGVGVDVGQLGLTRPSSKYISSVLVGNVVPTFIES